MANVSKIVVNRNGGILINEVGKPQKTVSDLIGIENQLVGNQKKNKDLQSNITYDNDKPEKVIKTKEVDISDYSIEDSEKFVSKLLNKSNNDFEITIVMDGKKHKITRVDLDAYNNYGTQKDIETGAQAKMTLKNYLYKTHQNWYFSSFKGKYGCDQDEINLLCSYVFNGKKYSYHAYMQKCEDERRQNSLAESSSKPNPFFKREITDPQYYKLRNKLIKQGFSTSDSTAILTLIDSVGACSHAAVVNGIITSYIGREKEFEKTFGFPMYIEKNGKKELNSAELLLDLFVYVNSTKNGGSIFTDDNKINDFLVRKEMLASSIRWWGHLKKLLETIILLFILK